MKRLALLAVMSVLLGACSGPNARFDLDGLPVPALRVPYDQQLEVTRGPEDVSFELTSGRLPFGVSLEPDGRLSGMPTSVQHCAFEITASAGERTWTAAADWTIADPEGFRLLVADPPVAPPGQAYSHRLEAVGASPDTYRLVRARTFTAGAGDPDDPVPLPYEDQAPAWLSLDASTGELSGTPGPDDRLILLWVAADAGGQTTEEVYALRVGDPAGPGWLEAKSEGYVERFLQVHRPSGLHVGLYAGGCYGNYGDSCCWSGTTLGGLAFRAAVLDTPEAAAPVADLLDALALLRRITGVPGLTGRSFEHLENIEGACGAWYMDPAGHEHHHEASGEYAGYRFWADPSRDQMTGNLWGHAIVWEVLADRPALRQQAAEQIGALAGHVWDNEMKLMDVDGEVTRYGVMSGYGWDGLDPYATGIHSLPNGMNALMLLNWFQMAARVASDPTDRSAFDQRFADLVSDRDNPEPGREFEHGYLDILHQNYCYDEYNPAGPNYFEHMQWFNVHMAFSNYFHLVRWCPEPGLRAILLDSFREVLWEDAEPMASGCDRPEARRARREFNPHFSWQYLAAKGDRDPEVIFEALTQLMLFAQPPRRNYRVDNPLGLASVPDHPDWACEPVPIHLQPPSSNYIWHRSPYRHTGGEDVAEHEDGGSDGFVPYWMGRYFGFVPAHI